MKEMIRDRILFALISCVALAAAVVLSIPGEVRLADDISEMLGPEATESFNTFFVELDAWYSSYPEEAQELGILLESDTDMLPLGDLIATLTAYQQADVSSLSEEQFARLNEYEAPLQEYVGLLYTMLMYMSMTGSVEFSPEDWQMIGDTAYSLMDTYRI